MQQHAARSIKQMCLPDVVAPGVVSVRPDDDIVAVDCYRNPKIVTGGHGGVVEGAQKVTRCHIKQICLTDVFALMAATMPKAFDPYHTWLGIAPHEQPANHYRLLGVPLFESDADIIQHGADQRMAYVR
jgi:hypothetical protein